MPSSKSQNVDEDLLVEEEIYDHALKTVTMYTHRTSTKKNVVTENEWIHDNFEHLTVMYRNIQEMGATSGIKVFDEDTCTFVRFCEIAYKNSFKYHKRDRYLYESQSDVIMF